MFWKMLSGGNIREGPGALGLVFGPLTREMHLVISRELLRRSGGAGVRTRRSVGSLRFLGRTICDTDCKNSCFNPPTRLATMLVAQGSWR